MFKIKSFFLISITVLVLSELISFVFYKLNLLEISHVPKLYLSDNFVPNDEWWIENKPWGAWHIPNSSTKQKKSCYDVTYTSNEIGARDTSFKDNADEDVILIGDSFAEGYGVNLQNTSQKYIENLTKRNVLNFGVSHNFGPVQYSIIYENLAKNFKHNTVIVYLLPNNDFGENDYSNWEGSKRYRPYYKLINDKTYKVFFPAESKKNYKSKTKKIKKLFKDTFWTSNIFINLNYNYKIYRSNKKNSSKTFSGYFDSSLKQQKAAIYFLNKIINNNSSNVLLVSIPRPSDYERLNNGFKLKDIYWNNYFTNKDLSNNKFKFIDLINYLPDNLNKIYLECDGHWSPEGNLWAAKIISKYVNMN